MAEIYPIGASNHTYKTLFLASSNGTGIPQSKSLVIALGFNPSLIHDLTCPKTFAFQLSLLSFKNHFFKKGSKLFNGRNQCFVFLSTGLFPLSFDFGFIKSVAFKLEPQLSH